MDEGPLVTWTWIDQVATRFDRAWQSGQRPRIEDFLGNEAEPRRTRLFEELLRVDLDYLRRAGEPPREPEYRRRFPGYGALIVDLFAEATATMVRPDPAAKEPGNGRGHAMDPAPGDPSGAADTRRDATGLATTLPPSSMERGNARPVAGEERGGPGGEDGPRLVLQERFQLLERIGRGGMGSVSKGRDLRLGRDLAVKVLLEEHRHNPELIRRFVEEAQISGQLQHPGVVPVFDLGAYPDDRPFFVMKLVKGQTLRELLAQRPSPAHDQPRLMAIFEQVCQTVAYAHSRRVVHRDLKPDNVMVGGFGEVQVMDWGLAKVLSLALEEDGAGVKTVVAPVREAGDGGTSQAGEVMGTPPYMAPEQARGELEGVDERADVFALGSMLCEILTGLPAYSGRSSQEIIRKARRGDTAEALVRLGSCGADAELIALTRDCLAPEPEDRPRGAPALAAAMRGYLDGVQERLRKSELARVEAQARAEGERKRRKLVVALATSVLLLVGVGAGAVLWLAARRAEAARRVGGAYAVAAAALERARAAVDDPNAWSEARAASDSMLSTAEAEVEALPVALSTQARRLHAEARRDHQAADLDRRLLRQVAELRNRSYRYDRGKVLAECAAAFRDYGIDGERPDVEAVVARLSTRHPRIRTRLATALDYWVYLEVDARFQNAHRKEPSGILGLLDRIKSFLPDLERLRRVWQPRIRIASAIDPNLVQNQIRAAGDRLDMGALKAVATTVNPRDISPDMAILIGLVLPATQQEIGPTGQTIEWFYRAQRAYPDDFGINNWLSHYLTRTRQPKWDEVIRFASVAAALNPGDVSPQVRLAEALEHVGRRDEADSHFRAALAAYRAGFAARPGDLDILRELARPLRREGFQRNNLEIRGEALRVLREAARQMPNDPEVRYDLGYALRQLRIDDEALSEFRAAAQLAPERPYPHQWIGEILQRRGDLDEALAAYRRASASFDRDPKETVANKERAKRLVANCERLRELDARLPALLAGEEPAKSPRNGSDLGRLCLIRQHFAAAVRYFEGVFTAQSESEENLGAEYRYSALIAAAQAGAGRGHDADRLSSDERARLRGRALVWLRGELDARLRMLEGGSSEDRAKVRGDLARWKADADLAVLRDASAVADLPEADRDAVRRFWAEVDELLARLREPG